MRIATWNLQWAAPGSARHARALDQLVGLDADIIVTTEDSVHDWAPYPHRLDAGSDWGYPIREGRRKVIAWSRTPWIDRAELRASATRGRFVQGATKVGGSLVQILAVCIPWQNAHVRTGRRDRSMWGEHLEFCEALKPAVAEAATAGVTIVAGDFNQRIPRFGQPRVVAEALEDALRPLEIPTSGEHPVGRLIDHIAVGRDVVVRDVTAWPNIIDGHRISDHRGVAVSLDTGLAGTHPGNRSHGIATR